MLLSPSPRFFGIIHELHSTRIIQDYRWRFRGIEGRSVAASGSDGGDKITGSLVYEYWPPDARKCAVIKNLG